MMGLVGTIRPDIGLVAMDGHVHMMDMVVCSPVSKSAIGGGPAAGLLDKRNEALRQAELRKNSKYRAKVEAKGGKFTPFAMSVMGVLGEESLAWLRALHKGVVQEEVMRTGMASRHVLGHFRFLEWVGRLQVAMLTGLNRGLRRKRNANMVMVQAAIHHHADGPLGVAAG